MAIDQFKVLVLRGGPDRERQVSLKSGAAVAAALVRAGHEVVESDICPDDLSILDQGSFDIIFPVLHGSWGEGGPLQETLDERGLPYVGCRHEAADLCMDKVRTKLVLIEHELPTPLFELLQRGQRPKLAAPLVLKPPLEGSSIGLEICLNNSDIQPALKRLDRHESLLAESFVCGRELTVGVIADASGLRVLPPICIVPAAGAYDFAAKYDRDDTKYLFDPAEAGLDEQVFANARTLAKKAFEILGCRHLSRVDLMADASGALWIIEVNTIPGFTDHSLLPKAAAHMGIDMSALVDRLIRQAIHDHRAIGSQQH